MFHNFTKAIAIACVSVAIGTASLSNLAYAQTDQTDRMEQMKPRQDFMRKLNLSEAQKTQMKAIRTNSMQRRQGVLTPDQKAKLEQARNNGNGRGWGKDLNLTTEQKQKLREINEDSMKQMNAVLTAEQKQQLQSFREQKKENRDARRNR